MIRASSEGAHETTVHHCKTLWAHAVRIGITDCNPFTACKVRIKTRAWWRPVSIEEWQRIDATLAKRGRECARCVVALARLAGLRRADAVALRWEQVDLATGLIRYTRGKTRRTGARPVVIPIGEELRRFLLDLPRRIDDRVCPPTAAPDMLTSHWSSVLHEAQVQPYGAAVHALVKSCLTDWARHVQPSTLQRMAGHASVTTTLTYYTTASDDEIAALAASA